MTVHRGSVRKKLGDILVHQGRITQEQLAKLLHGQKASGKPLGQVLIDQEILNVEELNNILGEQLGIPHVWLRKGLADPRIVHLLPKEKALQYQVIPLFCVNGKLTLATADPYSPFVFKEVSRISGMEILPVLCRVDDILDAINDCYRAEADMAEAMTQFEAAGIEVIQAHQEKTIGEITQLRAAR
jgi:type IV pilus assembly protein PilB